MVIKTNEAPTLHLTFIDGMRGIAALYVVLHHAFQGSQSASQSPQLWSYPFSHGHAMVTVFIAISGFCLMLPVARNGLTLRGGSGGFFKKRAHRILPPYYVALGLAILVELISRQSSTRMAYLRDPSTVLGVWSHVLMIHNWFPQAIFGIDGPLWSVATEVQIYLLFPLIVMAWRRFGPIQTLIVLCIFAHVGYSMIGHRVAINYLFIFALGMAGAELAVRRNAPRWLRWACWFSLIGYFFIFPGKDYISDFFIGSFASTLMALLSLGAVSPIRKALSVRVLTWLGSISYSLYLTHSVIQHIYLRTDIAARLANDPLKQFLVLVFCVTPIILVAAYLFYLVAERPFVNHTKKIVVATVTEPPIVVVVKPPSDISIVGA
jgi:peptidoglycan/LPS O-acetylase OafA/YrhL